MADRKRNPIFGPNRLKLGTFCTNTIGSFSTPPEGWRPEWDMVVRAAMLADQAGFEAIVPIARWKGYVDDRPDHVSNAVFDGFSFAAAIAQATRHAAIFATSHAPILHPITVAKMGATIDHISGGRFALNVVGGWNRREFAMFGIDLDSHEGRYAYLGEWLDIVRRLWTSDKEFDWDSDNFRMCGALCRPLPLQPAGPPIMNAGYSKQGMAFAASRSDIGLIMLEGDSPSRWAEQVEEYKAAARAAGNDRLQVWTNAQVILGRDGGEVAGLVRRYAHDFLDHESVNGFVGGLLRESGLEPDSPQAASMREKMASGTGFPLHGTARIIADLLAEISGAGIDGILLTWVNAADGLPPFAKDVLPLLTQRSLRSD